MIKAALELHEPDKVQPEILHTLEPGNEYLKGLVEDFFHVWGSQKVITKILCLYEQRRSSIGKVVGNLPMGMVS